MRAWVRSYWPHVFGSIVALGVGLPAGIASYRHGIEVVKMHGTDDAMAPWLPMTTDGLLLAALVVMWARRLTGREVGWGPWAAFIIGLAATLATNLGAAKLDPWGIGVALWPPFCLAVTLELVAMVVTPDKREQRERTQEQAADVPADVPEDADPEWVDPWERWGVPVPADVPAAVPADVPVPVPAAVPDVPVPVPAAVPAAVPVDVPVTVPAAVPAVPASEQDERDEDPGTKDGKATDEDILTWLRERAEEDRVVPGVRAIKAEFGAGTTRADRLRKQVSVPSRIRRVK
jgi:hypothetical protein